MIKQIKKIVTSVLCIAFVVNISGTLAEAEQTKIVTIKSDVVENKSVIEKQEQICLTSMSKAIDKERSKTNTQEKKKRDVYLEGWTSDNADVQKNPTLEATTLTTLNFNTKVKYTKYDKDWVKIKYDGDVAYMAKDYISNTEYEYIEYEVSNARNFKSYMGYKAITNRSSSQYRLQHEYATTGSYGIRQVNDRYCIAVGTRFKAEIGQYLDLVLKNGTIIPCILGDIKANRDTDTTNTFTVNGCCSEFIVDSSVLISAIKNSGNVSSATEEWDSPVEKIRVYSINVLK